MNPHPRTCLAFALVLFICPTVFSARAADDAHDLAAKACMSGDLAEALKILNPAIDKDPKNADLLALRGIVYSRLKEYGKAADDSSKSIEISKKYDELRAAGALYFYAGNIDASIAAFDAVAAHFPNEAPHLWERGISLYYAKRYVDGRKQFEDHKAVNPHDVENAAWHFICAAKEMGVEKARKALIFIDTTQDSRIPMKEVYLLFKGDGTPNDVLAAATAGDPTPKTLKNQLCYAHLYLGLYFEAAGDDKKARDHMEKAAVDYAEDHYMGQVARVHWEQMKKAK